MKLIITKHAFDRYCERVSVYQGDFNGFQIQLSKLTRAEMCFVEWQGKPAIYFNQTFWRYDRNEKKKEIKLVTCLGILETISDSKWTRLVASRNRRARKLDSGR